MSIGDFVYNPDESLLQEVLEKFSIPEEGPARFSLVRFECISPDSFMWRLGIGNHIYYLYAEDFVQGLDDIKSAFGAYLESDDFELISIREKFLLSFNESAPFRNAVTYKEPADSQKMMQFAATSGFYFAFLVKSSEDGHESLFSAYAPRGFGG